MLRISAVENRIPQNALTAHREHELNLHWIEVSTDRLRPGCISDLESSARIGKPREQLVAIWLDNRFHIPSNDVLTGQPLQHLFSEKDDQHAA